MSRVGICLCSLFCLAVAAPTVHLNRQPIEQYESNTEPLFLEPTHVTMAPIVETSYVDPLNVNYHQTIATANQQPMQLQPTYYNPTPYMNPYNLPTYQHHPSYSYQWQWPHSALPQQPIMQPPSTNVLPCSQTQHAVGYQQHGY